LMAEYAWLLGGNSGVGKETAVGLASLGGNVVIVCRNKNKGEAAWAEVKAKSRNENVDLMLADLSSFMSVRALAGSFKAKYGKLDVLVNNAGEILSKRHVTVDGLERTFASNHLGHFLLTNLLLDTIKASTHAQVINITSEAHRGQESTLTPFRGRKATARLGRTARRSLRTSCSLTSWRGS